MKYRKSDYGKPLEECCREENEDGISEYHTMLAISRMNATFSRKELSEEIANVLFNETLGDLVDKGAVNVVWDEKQEAFVFFPA